MKPEDHGRRMNSEEQSCIGCGAVLQSVEPREPGYVPEQSLGREGSICQRCFRIRHYNEASSVAVDADDFLQMIGSIANTDSLVVHIVDIFDFEGSLIGGLKRFVGGNPVILVVNKIDLLPKSVNLNRIVHWVKKQAKEQGLKVIDAVLCSAKKKFGFERVLDTIGRYREGRDVYVVGATNVGKSTLINRLIRDFSQLETELTTSRYPGTTLNFINIPLDDGRFIIDTPGVVFRYRMTELAPKNDLQVLLPEKPLKPIVYQLNEGQTLFFGGYARFDFIEGASQSFTCYVSNALRIHRTKLSNADEMYEKHKGSLLSPPHEDDLAVLPAWTIHPISIGRGERKDVSVSGLGWIRINSELGAKLALHVPKGVRIAIRDALI